MVRSRVLRLWITISGMQGTGFNRGVTDVIRVVNKLRTSLAHSDIER